MDVGSDTFPRDEVTGLAAFDHLDQVSTVSTLNMLPEVPAAPPKIFTPPPPPPMRSSVSVPPPAGRVSRTFSRPPEVPVSVRGSLPPPAAVPAEALRADTTEVIDMPTASMNGTFESWEDSDEASTRVVTMADGSPVPSTALQMDWDDEEPPTQMRGEGGVSQPRAIVDVDWNDDDVETHMGGTSTIGYTPAPASGRPSPFPSVRPSAPVVYSPSVRPGAPSPFVASEDETAWGQELQSDRRPMLLIGLGAAVIVALAFVARAMLAAPTPGIVTLATSPSDARVLVDGMPVSGTSSPYSATDVAPGKVHELVVKKAGYVEQRTLFTLEDGEAKTLPSIKLEAEAHAAAAAVPAQAAAAPGQVAAAPSAQATGEPSPVATAEPAQERKASSHHRGHHRRRAAAAPRAPHAARVKAMPKRPVVKAVAAAGGNGLLRINSRPWAQVFVDGRMVGNTPQMGIQLAPGNHSVKLVNPQMGLQKTVSVSVKNGQTVTKIMNLID